MHSLLIRILRIFPDYFEIARECLSTGSSRQLEVVHAVIFRKDKILFALRAHLRGWELPGGSLLPGESEETALIREVKEETGLEVTVERKVGSYRRTGLVPHKASVFRCRVDSGLMTPSEETPHLAWFRLQELPSTLFPWFRSELVDALANYEEEVNRIESQGLKVVMAAIWIDLAMRFSGDRAGGVVPVEESILHEP